MATELLMLYHGRVTRTTSELVLPSPNFHTHHDNGSTLNHDRFSMLQDSNPGLDNINREFFTMISSCPDI
ncbi:hypothetical protein TNCV_1704441 [Trichonephila clavipes]|nr:hypothetical protein TNCV_1704441 [Trichonephila clavipes]